MLNKYTEENEINRAYRSKISPSRVSVTDLRGLERSNELKSADWASSEMGSNRVELDWIGSSRLESNELAMLC